MDGKDCGSMHALHGPCAGAQAALPARKDVKGALRGSITPVFSGLPGFHTRPAVLNYPGRDSDPIPGQSDLFSRGEK